MGDTGRPSDTGNAVPENAQIKKQVDQAHRNTSSGPKETYDPYALVNPFDKEEVRRQKRLRRAALRGEIPLRYNEEEESAYGADTSKGASDAGDTTHDTSHDTTPQTEASRASANAESALVRKHKRKRRIIASVAAVLLLVVVCVGGHALYEYLRPPEFSSYADEGISIAGLEDDDYIVTPQQLSELECVEVSATGQGQGAQGESRVGTVSAYGPTLNTFLAEYGLSQTDFSRIIFECKDGYTVVLSRDALESEVILALSIDKDELSESHQPLRLVIPDEASGQWAYGVLRIEFEQ